MIYGGAYSIPGTVPVSIKEYKEVVFPILEKYRYDVDDSLFEGIEVDVDIKIIYPSQNKDGFPIINCPILGKELRNRIIEKKYIRYKNFCK